MRKQKNRTTNWLARALEIRQAAVLGNRMPIRWAWAPLTGSAMDLAMLARTITRRNHRRRQRVIVATAAGSGIAAAAAVCTVVYARWNGARQRNAQHLRRLHASVTVNRSRKEVYECWHDFRNLPSFMAHLESVQSHNGQSHWTAKGPVKRYVEWDAEIVEDRPEEKISWRSLEGSDISNSGSVRFTDAPGGRGTEVRVDMQYGAGGGKVGAAVAKLLGEHPEQQVRDDLRRFKQYLETGEVVRSEGSVEGHRALRQAKQRPARPMK